MTKILIDRAVVEQALHVATGAGYPVALIAALKAALAEPVQEPGNGGRTGWPPGLLQDDCRGLSKWLASRPDARQRLREALAEPVQEPPIWEQLAKIGNDALEAGALAEPVQEPVSVTELQAALVETNLIDPDALFDPDGYDNGVTLARVDALHELLFQRPAEPVQEPVPDRLEQLRAFCKWERVNSPHPEGLPHVAEWAVMEIDRLRAAKAQPVQARVKRSQDWHDGVIEGHLREREYWLAQQAQPVEPVQEPVPPIGKASTDVGVPVYVLKKAEPPCNPSCAPGYCYCEPVEPVAWRWRMRNLTDAPGFVQPWTVTTYYPREQANEIEPLYAAPPQRKPLTNTEMDAALRRAGIVATFEALRCIGRAVEAAHGIKEEK
jgi:hypothetical protein